MAELVNMASQFQGLPMDSLIGGPLTAAANTQVMLARSTAEFIDSVGFDWQKETVGGKDELVKKLRNVEFSYESTEQDPSTGKAYLKETKIVVPMLAIVPIPNLQIDTVDVTFDMEVKSSFSETAKEEKQGSFEAEMTAKIGPFSIRAKVQGSASSSKESTRTSDNSARYHVAVHATNHGMPEGLMRVLDMMAAAAAPRSEMAYELTDEGDKGKKIGPVPAGQQIPEKAGTKKINP
jgi:hypothetical protein